MRRTPVLGAAALAAVAALGLCAFLVLPEERPPTAAGPRAQSQPAGPPAPPPPVRVEGERRDPWTALQPGDVPADPGLAGSLAAPGPDAPDAALRGDQRPSEDRPVEPPRESVPPVLIQRLALETVPEARRALVVELGRTRGPDGSRALVAHLRVEPDADVRRTVVQQLQPRRDPVADLALEQTLVQDPAAPVRVSAAHALIPRAEQAQPPLQLLTRRLREETSPQVAAAIAASLGRVGEPAAASALVSAAQASSPQVRAAAASALSWHGGRVDPAQVAALAAAEPDPTVKAALEETLLVLDGQLQIKHAEGAARPAPRRKS